MSLTFGNRKKHRIILALLLVSVVVFAGFLVYRYVSGNFNDGGTVGGNEQTGGNEQIGGDSNMIDLTDYGRASGYILAYTTDEEDYTLGQSLHLAWSEDDSDYLALNSGSGICFARRLDGDHTITEPFLFYQQNGDFGVVAVSHSRPGSLSIYLSEDLVVFDQEIIVDLGVKSIPQEPQCYYDLDQDAYVLLWSDGNKQYSQLTSDFKEVSKPVETNYKIWTYEPVKKPENAVCGNVLAVDQAEIDYIRNKLMPVENISIGSLPEEVETSIGVVPELPKFAHAVYSDGSTAELPINWDDTQLNINDSGKYVINGEIGPRIYDNPFVESKADPCITQGTDGYYYFTASYPMYSQDDAEGYSKITLRRAATLTELANSPEITIWRSNDQDEIFRYIWAPEIHEIDGNWYVFFTGSVSPDDVFAIRPHLLKCAEGADPMEPDSWESVGRIKPGAGDTLSFQTFSLDMTYFEAGGRHYVSWAEKTTGDSLLYIAEIDPENPIRLQSPPTVLSMPEFAWEQVRYRVNEGSAVIKHEGKVFLTFSAAGTGPEYCIGLLSADEHADLLDRSSWSKNPYPILTTADVAGEYGPGHNSFTVDEYGNDISVYHARSEECFLGQCEYAGQDPLYDPCRHARIKNVHWAADGSPVLKMTPDQIINPEFKKVTIEVNVK